MISSLSIGAFSSQAAKPAGSTGAAETAPDPAGEHRNRTLTASAATAASGTARTAAATPARGSLLDLLA